MVIKPKQIGGEVSTIFKDLQGSRGPVGILGWMGGMISHSVREYLTGLMAFLMRMKNRPRAVRRGGFFVDFLSFCYYNNFYEMGRNEA